MLRLLQQRPADIQRPAGFQDPATFARTIELERVRSDRTEIPIGLVVFECLPTNRRSVIDRIELRARQTDQVGVFNDGRLGVILWNCGEAGARQFIAFVVAGVSSIDYELFLYPTPPVEPTDSNHKREHTESQADDYRDDRSDTVCHGTTDSWANATQNVEGQSQTTAVEELTNLHCYEWPASKSYASDSKYAVGQFELADHALMVSDEAENDWVSVASQTVERQDRSVGDAALEQVEHLQTIAANELANDLPHHDAQPLETIFMRPLPTGKRTLDVLGASLGLIVLGPLLLMAAALIKLTSRGPVLFKQTREGLGGRLFTIYKFRTMFLDADKRKDTLRDGSEQDGPCFKMEHDPRITPLGRYLRKTCIDELPQLWNVLIGDMTLVGPRPLDYRESHKIHQWGRRRLEVTPGLTCIWQVHGKSRVSFNEWMRMDIRYMRRGGLFFDLKLIRETIQQVLLHRASH